MTDQPIKVGDRVKLISGGPPMTVNDIEGDDIDVTWFDGDENVKKDRFSRHVLKIFKPALTGRTTRV